MSTDTKGNLITYFDHTEHNITVVYRIFNIAMHVGHRPLSLPVAHDSASPFLEQHSGARRRFRIFDMVSIKIVFIK